jgi:cytochrome c oxidase assembly protein subunit 15
MFALIVVGSIVRTTGSGLACPDWPLCHGRLIPPLQFNILVEWFHRLLALLVSVLLAATVGLVAFRAELRARLGGLAALSVALLLAQVLLGALTVWKLLDPSVVSGHLAVALMLFGTMLTLALAARHEAGEAAPVSPGARAGALLPLFGTTTVFVFLQAVLGGMVSTHHASLACPDWPTCNGEWFPPLEGLVGLQMAHRFAGYALTALVVTVAVCSRGAGDARVWGAALALAALTIAQVALGVTNVMLGIPVWVSALHLGNAAAMLALALATTFRLAVLPRVESRSVTRATSRGAAS